MRKRTVYSLSFYEASPATFYCLHCSYPDTSRPNSVTLIGWFKNAKTRRETRAALLTLAHWDPIESQDQRKCCWLVGNRSVDQSAAHSPANRPEAWPVRVSQWGWQTIGRVCEWDQNRTYVIKDRHTLNASKVPLTNKKEIYGSRGTESDGNGIVFFLDIHCDCPQRRSTYDPAFSDVFILLSSISSFLVKYTQQKWKKDAPATQSYAWETGAFRAGPPSSWCRKWRTLHTHKHMHIHRWWHVKAQQSCTQKHHNKLEPHKNYFQRRGKQDHHGTKHTRSCKSHTPDVVIIPTRKWNKRSLSEKKLTRHASNKDSETEATLNGSKRMKGRNWNKEQTGTTSHRAQRQCMEYCDGRGAPQVPHTHMWLLRCVWYTFSIWHHFAELLISTCWRHSLWQDAYTKT